MSQQIDIFAAELSQQLSLYEQLLRLCDLQRDYIASERVDDLLGLLSQREVILQEASAIEARILPLKQRWKEVAVRLDAAKRGEVEVVLRKIRETLGKITSSDADDAMVLQQRKLDVRKQIRGTGQQQQVVHGYAKSAYAQGQAQTKLNVTR